MPRGQRPSREEMKARIEEARRDEGLAVALAARKGAADEASDDELAELLEEIEILREGASGRGCRSQERSDAQGAPHAGQEAEREGQGRSALAFAEAECLA
jgi:hypothetical protein